VERARLVDWRRVAFGSLLGFGVSAIVFAAMSVVGLFVHGTLDNAIETAISLVVLVGYLLAGYIAVGPDAAFPATEGALAGIGAVGLGLVTSLALWAARQHGAFLRGDRANHPGIALFGPVVFGAIFAALGGIWSARKHASAAITNGSASV
jgi:hypothetical protein